MPVEARFPCNFPVFRRPISQILRLRRATLLVSYFLLSGGRAKKTHFCVAPESGFFLRGTSTCACACGTSHVACGNMQMQDTDTTSQNAISDTGCKGLNMLRKQMHRGPLHPWVRSTCLIDWLCHARACLVSGSPWLWPWAQNKQWRSLLRMH